MPRVLRYDFVRAVRLSAEDGAWVRGEAARLGVSFGAVMRLAVHELRFLGERPRWVRLESGAVSDKGYDDRVG